MNPPAISLPSVRGKQCRSVWLSALCLALAGLFIPSALAVTGTMSGDAADAQVNRLAGVNSVTGATSGHCRIGNNSADDQQMSVVHVFEIPPAILADPTQWFDTASYTARLSGKVVTTRNADLYGLGYRTTSAVLASDFYAGASDGASTLLKDNFLVPSMTYPSLIVESGSALTSYLNAQLAAARAANATSAYVFLRTNIDSIGNYQYYQLGMNEGGGANIPTIAYSTVIIPAWVQVPLGGGGCVNGLISNSSGTDIYCRTDVGTAFRWVPAVDGLNGQWLSITDTIVPTTTTGAIGLASTASIAIDPNNSNNLYVAVGSKYAPLHGIYASSDRGATWSVIPGTTTWVIDGNGTYNGTGERLAVDPNNANILWYGSTENGLQKGVKSGSSWSWTQQTAVPVGANTSGDGKAGVTFVACDPNSGSTIVYAGVFNSVTAGAGGIWQSLDGGTTWTKVSGVAVDRPNRGQVAPNGTLYVTAGITKSSAPSMINGMVAKAPRGGSLVDITPPGGNIHYRGLAVDPNDLTGNTVYVAHLSPSSSYNRIWRSTNGGASGSWVVQDQTNMNKTGTTTIARSEPDGTPALTGYWLGAISSLLITPGNANELWAGDYFGVARTRNATQLGGAAGSQSIWYMLQKNQDETCVEAVRNAPTGAELMTGTADVGGFKYNDISQRPTGAYGSVFTNPGGANVNSLDFCETNNSIWARTWTGNTKIPGTNDLFGSGGYSRDGGTTWNAFGQITTNTILSSLTAGWETLDVTAYLKGQKARGATSVTLVLASFKNTKGVDTAGNPLVNGAVLSFDSREATNKPYLILNGGTSLIASADSTVAGATPTTNLGGDPTLGTSWSWGDPLGERHIYLRFDLSTVGSINTAILNLYRIAATSSSTAGVSYSVTVFACSNNTTVGGSTPWNESTITWSAGRRKPYASDTDQLFSADPHFSTEAGAYLSGGRVAVSATDPDRLVWLPFAKLTAPLNVPHYSDDAGATWNVCAGLPTVIRLYSKSNPSYLIQQLAADRVNANTFYIMDPGGTNGAKNFYKSTDGGANWNFVSSLAKTTTAANVYRVQIVAAPAAGHVWVTDDGVDNNSTEGGLWKSTDGTSTWSAKLPNIVGVRQVAFGKPPVGSSYLYSVYIHGYYNGVKGIYRSDDYGSTWTALPALPSVISVESLAGDRQIPGGVFIGTGGRGAFQYQP